MLKFLKKIHEFNQIFKIRENSFFHIIVTKTFRNHAADYSDATVEWELKWTVEDFDTAGVKTVTSKSIRRNVAGMT